MLGADVDVVFRDIDEIAIDIGPGCVRIWETVDGRDLRDFGLVQVLAYHRPTASLLNAVADYAAANGVRAVNIAGIGAPTKLFKYVRLASRGLSVPLTIYRPARLLTDGYEDMASHLDLPFVLKTVTGGSGRLTSLVGNERAFGRRLGDVEHARVGFLAQEFVPPDGTFLLAAASPDVPEAPLALVLPALGAGVAAVAMTVRRRRRGGVGTETSA